MTELCTLPSAMEDELRRRYLPLHGSPRMTTLHVHVTFLYISLPSLKGYDVKVPNRNVF